MIDIDSEEEYLVCRDFLKVLRKLNIDSSRFFWAQFSKIYDVQYERCYDCDVIMSECRCNEPQEEQNRYYREYDDEA